jgi:hypothetical protein
MASYVRVNSPRRQDRPELADIGATLLKPKKKKRRSKKKLRRREQQAALARQRSHERSMVDNWHPPTPSFMTTEARSARFAEDVDVTAGEVHGCERWEGVVAVYVRRHNSSLRKHL